MENLSRADILAMASKAADHITFNCDGISCGFEITHKGYIALIDYESQLCNEERREAVAVPAVWDTHGKNHPDIAEALQCLIDETHPLTTTEHARVH